MRSGLDEPEMPKRTASTFLIDEGAGELLAAIESLWDALRAHHAALSSTWRRSIEAAAWPARREALFAKSSGGGAMLVLLARRADDRPARGDVIGYCVCTITAARQGEIDSLFVTPAFRGAGVGRALMLRATRWLDERKADPVVVDVLADNADAVRFYERFGFASRTVTMRRRQENQRSQ